MNFRNRAGVCAVLSYFWTVRSELQPAVEAATFDFDWKKRFRPSIGDSNTYQLALATITQAANSINTPPPSRAIPFGNLPSLAPNGLFSAITCTNSCMRYKQ